MQSLRHGHQFKAFRLKALAHLADIIEDHGSTIARVRGPMRQVRMIWIAVPSKGNIGARNTFGHRQCFRTQPAILKATNRIVEREDKIAGMEGTWAAIQHWGMPVVDIDIGWRGVE